MIVQILIKAWRLLSLREQRHFRWLISVNTGAALVELFGVFSVLPFLAVAGDAALVDSGGVIGSIRAFFGAQTHAELVTVLGLLCVASLVLTNLSGIASMWFRSLYCNQVTAGLSQRLYAGYLAQRYEFFLGKNSSTLSKDLLNEVQQFHAYVVDPITNIISRGLQILVVGAGLLVYDWRVLGVIVLLFGGFYCIVYLILERRLHRIGQTRWKSSELRHRLVNESLTGIREVKMFGRETWYTNEFSRETKRLASLNTRCSAYGFSPRYLIESVAFTALILFVVFSLRGGANLAAVIPVLGVFAVAGMRLMPAIQIVFQFSSVLRANGIMVDRLTDIFAELRLLAGKTMAEEPPRLQFRSEIAIKNVTFVYPAGVKPALKNISLTIPAKSCVGIFGASGSGKSTLMDVAMGILFPGDGRVLIDGIPLGPDVSRSWQRNVGYVSQAFHLLDASIAQNIAFDFNVSRIDMARVRRAANQARLDAYVDGLPDGYATMVGEKGVRLSGGQRQRIAIARALYNDPEVLFLDEATSALDSETEEAIVESVKSLASQKTIIIVAHRLSTLRDCDFICEVVDGELGSILNYRDLVVKKGATL